MHYIPIALAAYFFNGIAVLTDKFLLSHKITHPLIYIFYISLVSLLILVLIPFAGIPTLSVFVLASVSTILWTSGLYMLYRALMVGLITRVVPIIGALIPVMLAVYAAYTGDITRLQLLAVSILILGIVCLTFFEIKGKMHKHELKYELVAAILFAFSYMILRQAYLQEHFFTVFVWSRVILVPLGIVILCIPKSRHIVFGDKQNKTFSFRSKPGLLFTAGQVSGGLSELLLTFSVSLASPALVNSLQGSQYIFLFVVSFFLSKKFPHAFEEKHTPLALLLKIAGIICVGVGLYIIAFTKV